MSALFDEHGYEAGPPVDTESSEVCSSFHEARRIFRWPMTLAALWALPGLVAVASHGVASVLQEQDLRGPVSLGFGIGVVFCLAMYVTCPAYNIFMHELGHAIMATLFFGTVDRFSSTSTHGYVGYSGGCAGAVGNHLFSTAPYWLPAFTVLAVALRGFVPEEHLGVYYTFIGACLGHRAISTLGETLRGVATAYGEQPVGGEGATQHDMESEGRFCSLVAIATYFLVTMSTITFLLARVDDGVSIWQETVVSTSTDFYRPLFDWVMEQLDRFKYHGY